MKRLDKRKVKSACKTLGIEYNDEFYTKLNIMLGLDLSDLQPEGTEVEESDDAVKALGVIKIGKEFQLVETPVNKDEMVVIAKSDFQPRIELEMKKVFAEKMSEFTRRPRG